MNNKNDNQKISKIAIERCKRFNKGFSLHLCLFAVLTIVCFGIAYIFSASLIITVPFVILPAFFAFLAVNVVDKKQSFEGFGFFVMFRRYFNRMFYGGYRVLISFLKSLLVYLISSFIITIIFSISVVGKNPEYISFLEQVATVQDTEEMINLYLEFIGSNSLFDAFFFILIGSSFGAATIMFVHQIGLNSVKYYQNFLTKTPIPMNELNLIHKETYRKNKRAILKDYFSSLWFVPLVIVIGIASGMIIEYFVLKDTNFGEAYIIGLFISLIILLPFMNYISNVFVSIFIKYSENYINTFVDLSLKALEEIKKTKQIDSEKEEKIRQFLEDSKAKNNENKEENKEEE